MKIPALPACVCAVVLVVAGSTTAQTPAIPVDQEPNHHVVFSTPLMRVLDVSIGAGVTSLEHRHDYDIATINVENGLTRSRTAGEEWGATRTRMVGETNVTEYTGKSSAHTVQNLDSRLAYKLTAIENRRPSGWTKSAALAAPATSLISEARSFRMYDVRLGTTVRTTRHIHSVPVVVSLVSGRVSTGSGDAKMLTRPGQWVVVPADAPHTLEAAVGGDVRVIEVEVR